MQILELSKKMFYLLKNQYITEDEKFKQLNEGVKLLKKEHILELLNFPHDTISENSNDFTIANCIQLKAMLFKYPINKIIINKIGDFDFIYENKMNFNLLNLNDIEYYLERDPEFLNRKIKNSEDTVLKYLFISNKYTSFNSIFELFKNKFDYINEENKKMVISYLKENKETLINNYKNNIFYFSLLPETLFNEIFPEIKEDKEISLLKELPKEKMEAALNHFLSSNLFEKEKVNGSLILKIFFDNAIDISENTLRKTLNISNELTLPSLINFENFNYLRKNSAIIKHLSLKYKAFGTEEEQSLFVSKVMSLNFDINQLNSSLLFIKEIPDSFIMSKKLKEFNLLLRVLGNEEFNHENITLLVKNMDAISLKELSESKLFKNKKLLKPLIPSYVSESDLMSRIKYFITQYEQRILFNSIIENTPENKLSKKRL